MNNKLYLAAIASAVVLTPSFVAPIPTEAATNKMHFKDVPPNHTYFAEIQYMKEKGIISGYGNNLFGTTNKISKKHAAALINRAVDLPVVTKHQKFLDVSEKNAYYHDIKKLQMAGVFEADAKGNFNPNQPLTRAEMAKVLTIAFDLKTTEAKDFPDVSKNHPQYKYVKAIYSNGITTGDGGLYKPNDSLTRAHYAVFMYRAMLMEKSNEDLEPMTEDEWNALSNEKLIKKLVMYNYEHGDDVPLPKGQKDRTSFSKIREKEFNTYFVQNGLDRRTSTPLISRYSVDIQLKNISRITNKNLSEVIKMHNHVVTTGEMITNTENDTVNFAMYFNFEENRFNFAFKS